MRDLNITQRWQVSLFCGLALLTQSGFASVRTVPVQHATIQAALDAAVTGDEIIVAPGLYKENLSFAGKAVYLHSSQGAENTIIDGNKTGVVVKFDNAETRSSRLSGFTLQNGMNSTLGGAIQINDSAPQIDHNIIRNNQGGTGGGAISVKNGEPLIEYNEFIANHDSSQASGSGGGAAIGLNGSSCRGGQTCQAHISHNTFSSNYLDSLISGGALYLSDSGQTQIENNFFDGNEAQQGGAIAIINSPDVNLIQNIFANNVATETRGDTLYLTGNHAQGVLVLNNTIASNLINDQRGKVSTLYLAANSGVRLFNNIIMANHAYAGVFCLAGSSVSNISFASNNIYSALGAAYQGACSTQTGTNNNISRAAKFSGNFVTANTFLPKSSSVTVEAGDNTAPSLPSTDFAGNPRISDHNQDGVVLIDMGAFERLPGASVVSTPPANMIITTIAGSKRLSGNTGNGGLATLATLNQPHKVRLDRAGNIFITDRFNHQIRKIDNKGNINIFAGTGEAGYSGDGGPANQAKLNGPTDMALDSQGNWLILDGNNSNNSVVRQVTSEGIISSLNSNKLGRVVGAAIDTQDKLYVTDIFRDSVFTKTPSDDGFLNHPGDSIIAVPKDVAINSKGEVFVVSNTQSAVFQLTETNSFIVVGGTKIGFSGDNGPAIDAHLSVPEGIAFDSEDNLYIADTGNHVIRKVDTNGIIHTIAGTPGKKSSSFLDLGDGGLALEATLNTPSGVEVDDDGIIYVADTQNNMIRRIAAAGAGSNSRSNFTLTPLLNPAELAVNTNHNFTVHWDQGGTAESAAIINVFAHPGTVNQTTLTTDSSGNAHFTLLSTTQGRGRVTVSAANGGPSLQYRFVYGEGPSILLVDKQGDGSGRIVSSAGLSGKGIDCGEQCSESYPEASQVTVQAIADAGSRFIGWRGVCTGIFSKQTLTIGNVDQCTAHFSLLSAPITTIAGSNLKGDSVDNGAAIAAQFKLIAGLAVDKSGNIYITDAASHRVRKVDSSGRITAFAGTGIAGFSGDGRSAQLAQLNFPNDVAVDDTGNVYIADTNNHRIRGVDLQGNIFTLAGTGVAGFSGDGGTGNQAQLNRPIGISPTKEGGLLIADFNNHRIRLLSSDLIINTVAGNGTAAYSGDGGLALNASLNTPTHAIQDSEGNIFIADYSNHRIRGVTAAGIIVTLAGTGTAGFSGDGNYAELANLNYPVSLQLDPRGLLFVVDSLNHRIRQIDGNRIINTVVGINQSGYAGDGGAAAQARLTAPWGIAIADNNNLYIADSGNYVVRQIGNGQGVVSPAYLEPQADNGGINPEPSNPDQVSGTDDPVNTDPVVNPDDNTIPIPDPVINQLSRLTISKVGNGSGTITAPTGENTGINCGQSCIEDYAQNRIIELTAVAGQGAVFAGWSGACSGTDSSLSINLSADVSCTAIFSLASQDDIITTFAGNGSNGSNGDGGLGIEAQLSGGLYGLAYDGLGNLYVADSDNHKVRKITPEGVISTFAGTGLAGNNGDGGSALQANLSVLNVAVDVHNQVYILDSLHNVVRKVDSQGIITSIAGTGEQGFKGDGAAAELALFNHPQGIYVSSGGSIYIADTGNHRIRRIDQLGIINTIAGSGTAGFAGDQAAAISANLNAPTSVTLDQQGLLLIGDSQNARVRRVDAAGNIHTIVGSGSGYTGDGGLAVDAKIRWPAALIVDQQNQLYIADRDNHVIRRIDNNGIIDTIAGNNQAGFTGDGGSALQAQLNSPESLSLDVAGNLYIGDTKNNRIRRLDSGNRRLLQVSQAGNGSGRIDSDDQQILCGTLCAAAYQPDNVVILSAIPDAGQSFIGWRGDCAGTVARLALVMNTDKICTAVFDPQTAAVAQGIVQTLAGLGSSGFSGDGAIANQAALRFPAQLALDSQDRIYIADSLNNRIRRIDKQGIINSFAGDGDFNFGGDQALAILAKLRNPYGLGFDKLGNTYIADTLNHRIRRINSAGIIETIAGNGDFGFQGDGGVATQARLNLPHSVAVGRDGTVYIADTNNHRLRKIDSQGNISSIAGTGIAGFSGDGQFATLAQLNFPTAVYISPANELYVADSANHRIRKIDQNGIISTPVGSGETGFGAGSYAGDGELASLATLNNPRFVTLDSKGQLYIADTGNHRVRLVDNNGIINTLVGTGTAGYNGDGHAPTETQLNQPVGLALDSKNNLYIADYANHRIRQIISSNPSLTVMVSGSGLGKVSHIVNNASLIDCGTLCQANYALNSSVLLTATPEAGSLFSTWQGDCRGTAVTTQISMGKDQQCEAVFELDPAFNLPDCPAAIQINIACNAKNKALSNIRVGTEGRVYNAQFSGEISNAGLIFNSSFAVGSLITGGRIGGILNGEVGANIAVLKNVQIEANAQVSHLLLDQGSQTQASVKIGIGTRFSSLQQSASGLDLSLATPIAAENCTAVSQPPALDTNKDIFFSAPNTLLDDINQIDLLKNNGWALQQSADFGYLQLNADGLQLAIRPISLKQTDLNGSTRGIQRDGQNIIRLTTPRGLTLTAQPAIQNLCGLHVQLSQAGLLGLRVASDGTLHLNSQIATVRFVFRPDLISTPHTQAQASGIQTRVSPHSPDLPLAYMVFIDSTGIKRDQILSPAVADSAALLAADPQVQFENAGVISFNFNGIHYRGVLDYQVIQDTAIGDTLQVQSITGSQDATLVYPDGSRQRLFVLTP